MGVFKKVWDLLMGNHLGKCYKCRGQLMYVPMAKYTKVYCPNCEKEWRKP